MTWDVVHDGRSTFIACMRAFCSPGTAIELPPSPQFSAHRELDGAAAILLALLDPGLTLAVAGDAAAREVAIMAAEQTGATESETDFADWILVHGPVADTLTRARRGEPQAPEQGATVVVATTSPAVPMVLSGPGIDGSTTAYVPLDALSAHAFTTVNASSPCGVDVLIVTPECLIGLPRSVSMRLEDN
jgi:alpha-D-ribose 1-methylphosphonate 5-triphosphate synthase subunit PhnH